MIRAAFRGEMRKMWKRPATWVTLGLFGLIMFADLFDEYRDARSEGGDPFFLPDAWSRILGEEIVIGFVFASVLLILLVAAEFSWRTARQNVIDGLSKTQWYSTKLLLVPLLTALFLAIRATLGGILAWAGTDPASTDVLLGSTQLRALAGMWLAGTGYASLALLAATAIRAAGPAMAVWFAWFAFGERLLAGGLASLFEPLRPMLRWTPISTFSRLARYDLYADPAVAQTTLEPAVVGTLVWIAALAIGGWLWYRRRDL